MPEETKQCPGCGVTKSLSEFHKNRSTCDGRHYACKECRKAESRKYLLNNPEAVKKSKYKTRFNLVLEQYHRMLLEQDGLCGICRKPESRKRSFSVDHNHDTGKIRGLLCSRCNLGIGQFGDQIDLLNKAVDYLRKSSG